MQFRNLKKNPDALVTIRIFWVAKELFSRGQPNFVDADIFCTAVLPSSDNGLVDVNYGSTAISLIVLSKTYPIPFHNTLG